MTTLTTYSGREYDLTLPPIGVLSIQDIAQSLSQLCRFTGHCVRFYSVAQHSVMVSRLVPREYALCGLLHDATEAVLGDVSTPLKQLLPEYRKLEGDVWLTLAIQFNLPARLHPCVKHADLVALATERRDLMSSSSVPWAILDGIEPDDAPIITQLPEAARRAFMQRYLELTA